MTVQELIKKLEKLPISAEINFLSIGENAFNDITYTKINGTIISTNL